MTEILIHNAKIITHDNVIANGWLYSTDGKISAYGAGDAPTYPDAVQIDADGKTLLPGFIDVHIHGANGADTMDGTPEALTTIAQFKIKHGVTSFLPTTLTAKTQPTIDALNTIRDLCGVVEFGAEILGAHLEGPYFNAEKAGAQSLEDIRRADVEEATAFLDVGVIRLLSIAPEFSENHWLIAECKRRGVTVSVAHTNATYEQTVKGIELGISHSTHTYNAMSGLHHRDPGVLGAVLGDANVYCELIPDNIHVHPGAMKALYQAKGKHRLMLITDAMSAAGKPDGTYKLHEYNVIVKDGSARLVDNGALAGSILTYERGVYNFLQATGETIENVWQVTSLNQAQSIGVADRKGSIQRGKDADLILIDDNINVYLSIVCGKVQYHHDDVLLTTK